MSTSNVVTLDFYMGLRHVWPPLTWIEIPDISTALADKHSCYQMLHVCHDNMWNQQLTQAHPSMIKHLLSTKCYVISYNRCAFNSWIDSAVHKRAFQKLEGKWISTNLRVVHRLRHRKRAYKQLHKPNTCGFISACKSDHEYTMSSMNQVMTTMNIIIKSNRCVIIHWGYIGQAQVHSAIWWCNAQWNCLIPSTEALIKSFLCSF